MFSYLFNTYEAVAPPPKSKPDLKQEIYQGPDQDTLVIDPLGLGPISRVPNVEKPSDQFNFEQEGVQEIPEYSTNNQLVTNIINTGRSLLGNRYKYGGTNPNTGLDCSAFLQYIFKQNGVDIPRDTSGQFKVGREVSLSNAQPGDIICSKGSGKSGRHVQMISKIDPDTNQIYVIEAKGEKYGIVESPLTKKGSDIISVRRVINQNNKDPFLVNQDLQNPTKVKFNNREDFTKALSNTYREVLAEKGLDLNYAYILTAQDALESNWGKRQAGKFNFGGIKGGNSIPKQTFEYINGKKKSTTSSFRNFNSLKDYCTYKVNLMSNQRYNIFNRTTASNPLHVIATINNAGYSTTPTAQYSKSVMNAYNQVMNYVT